jgi:hypothetical protein
MLIIRGHCATSLCRLPATAYRLWYNLPVVLPHFSIGRSTALTALLTLTAAVVATNAITIAEFDTLPDAKARSTKLASVITAVTSDLVKSLLSPTTANGQPKTTQQAARDKARAALVPRAATGTLTASDQIGLLAVRIAVARKNAPASTLEAIVRQWILDEVTKFESAPAKAPAK